MKKIIWISDKIINMMRCRVGRHWARYKRRHGIGSLQEGLNTTLLGAHFINYERVRVLLETKESECLALW